MHVHYAGHQAVSGAQHPYVVLSHCSSVRGVLTPCRCPCCKAAATLARTDTNCRRAPGAAAASGLAAVSTRHHHRSEFAAMPAGRDRSNHCCPRCSTTPALQQSVTHNRLRHLCSSAWDSQQHCAGAPVARQQQWLRQTWTAGSRCSSSFRTGSCEHMPSSPQHWGAGPMA